MGVSKRRDLTMFEEGKNVSFTGVPMSSGGAL
jgi:hypothetical protein